MYYIFIYLLLIMKARKLNMKSQIFVAEMEKTRKHSGLLYMLIAVLKQCLAYTPVAVLGIKIQIAGKINGKLRAKTRCFNVGLSVPAQALCSNIDYSLVEAFTYTGVFGIKVWVYMQPQLA